MKSYNHLFDPGIASFESLYRAAKRAEKNKRMKPEVLAFNGRLEENLFALERELKGKTYTQGGISIVLRLRPENKANCRCAVS